MNGIDRLNDLCAEVVFERDPQKLIDLGREINWLFQQEHWKVTFGKHPTSDKLAAFGHQSPQVSEKLSPDKGVPRVLQLRDGCFDLCLPSDEVPWAWFVGYQMIRA